MSIKKYQRRLPVEYQEVEYLESTGTQYIETNIIPTQGVTIKTDIYCNSYSSSSTIVPIYSGSSPSGSSEFPQFGVAFSIRAYFKYFATGQAPSVPYTSLQWMHLEITSNGKLTLAGNSCTSTYAGEINEPLFLFVRPTQPKTAYFNGRMKTIEIGNNGVPIATLVPCYRKSDNEAGMYDIVNNVFYTNQGTGSFSVGSDVDISVWNPIPYRQYHANATSLTSDEITTDGSNISGLSIAGNIVQNGTPAPDNIIYPQECGDKTYNQLDLSKSELNCYYNENGIRIASDYHDTTEFLPVESGRTYTVYVAKTGATGGYGVYINLWDLDKEFYSNLTLRRAMNGYYTFTSPINGYCRFNYLERYGLTKDEMFYEDSRELPYKPYGYEIPITINNTTYPIYLSEPLRKIGDYVDTINSDGTVTRNIKKVEFKGTEEWRKSASGYNAFYTSIVMKLVNCNLLCNMAVYKPFIDNILPIEYKTEPWIAVSDAYFGMSTDSSVIGGTEINNFRDWLAELYAAGTPVTVWYVLATPTTEQITLPSISTTSGQNTVTVDTTLPPSDIKISNRWENKGYGSVVNNGDWHYSNSVDYLQSFSILQLQSKTVNELQGG